MRAILFVTFSLSFLQFGFASKPTLSQYEGQWNLVKGNKHECPDTLAFQEIASGELELNNLRSYSQAKFKFSAQKTLSGKSSRQISATKENKKFIKKDYTLLGTYTTSVVKGNLVSSHIWSSPGQDWQSTGLKIFSLADSGKVLKLEKVITGYSDKNEDDSKGSKVTQPFQHSNGHAVQSSSIACAFKKASKASASK